MPRAGLAELVDRARAEGRRLVAPLLGFPGVEMAGSNIKLAQQNFGEHYRAVKSLADRFAPDLVFPLMDLSIEANAVGRTTVFPRQDSATVVREPFHFDEIDRMQDIRIAIDSRNLCLVETLKMMSIGLPSGILKGAYVVGPYTLAGLIMGADEAAMATLTDPDGLHRLCGFAAEKIREYGRLLISAGAEVIAVLEPSAVMLGPAQFREFSAAYVRDLAARFRRSGVSSIYHVCGNTMHLLADMAAAGVAGLSLDAPETGVDLPLAAQRVPPETILIGNISPTGAMLRGTPEEVRRGVEALLDGMSGVDRFVLSTGCDLPQETPPANIDAFMRAGREHRL